MNSPVAVAIDRQSQDHLHLPGIVVCPVRGLNASRLVHDGLPLHLVDIIMEEFAIPGRWLRLSNHTNYDLEINNVDLNNFVLNRNFTDFAQLLLYYSYEPEEFIHELQNENFNGKMPNYTKIFAGYNGGICFAYESNEMCSWPGMQGGFRMVLKLPPRTKYDRGAEDGWIIGVGSQVITPPTKFDKIPANSAIDIELNEISYERILSMGWPKSGVLCDNDPRHRSTSDCFLAGYSYAIRSVCNCLPFQAPYLVRRSENDTTCTPVQFNICAQKEINSILEKTQKQQKRCVPVCRETVFETTVSLNSLEKGWGNAVFGVLENMVRFAMLKRNLHLLYKIA